MGWTVGARAHPDSPVLEARRSPARLAYLDGLRALAALYVMLTHAFSTIWPSEFQKYPTGPLAALTRWLSYGHFAVTAFIVISGFCLMLPIVRNGGLLKGGGRQFFKKRARRILPPYYCALVVSALLATTIISSPTGTHWDVSLPVTIPALYSHVILLQDFVYAGKINHVLWSVAVEWQIYFLFPLLVILWRCAGPVATTLGALAIAYAAHIGLQRLGIIPPDGASAIVPQYVGMFVLGMAGAALAFGPSARRRLLIDRIPWSLLAVCALAALCVLNSKNSVSDVAYADIVAGIATTCALIGASQTRRDLLRRVLSWRPLVFVGTMSYSLYLIHAPLLQILWQYVLRPWHLSDSVTFAALVIATPLIVAGAYLFFLVCERPFLTSPPPFHPWIMRLVVITSFSRRLPRWQRTIPGTVAVEDEIVR